MFPVFIPEVLAKTSHQQATQIKHTAALNKNCRFCGFECCWKYLKNVITQLKKIHNIGLVDFKNFHTEILLDDL